jgi:signal transduction histidine kinase
MLSAALFAASVISTAMIIHDTSRQRAAVHSVVRSTAEQVVALAGSRLEILALETFAPAIPWSSARPAGDSALRAMARAQRSATRCRCRDTLSATEFFRYDLGSRVLSRHAADDAKASSDAPSSAALERVALNEQTRAGAHPELAIHLVVGRDLGAHAALTAVEYDSAGRPFAVYGVLTRARALAIPLFRDAAARASLIDSAGRRASLRMIEFQVMGPDSTTILNTLDDAYPFRATIRSGGPLEGLTVTAALAADQIPIRLNVGSTERLHLGVLLVATILVVGFAMGSSRRELLLARARSDFIAQILIAGETLTLERERDAEDRRALSHAIVREARRLVGIVDNVLLFSRTGATRQKPRLRPVPVDDLFDDVIEAAGLAVDDAAQSIAVRAPSSLLVLGDRQLLRQALVNLVDNALKYGPRGQHIELGAELASATAVRLYVDDHGPGIPAEERARLFEPYERMFRDRTSERTGSGLGLAVVREIAAALDGRAWLADAPGGGTRAVIELRHAEQVTAASSTVGMG